MTKAIWVDSNVSNHKGTCMSAAGTTVHAFFQLTCVTMIHVHVKCDFIMSTLFDVRMRAGVGALHRYASRRRPHTLAAHRFWPWFWVSGPPARLSTSTGPQHATGSSWRLRLRCAVIARTSCVKIQSVSQFRRAPPALTPPPVTILRKGVGEYVHALTRALPWAGVWPSVGRR